MSSNYSLSCIQLIMHKIVFIKCTLNRIDTCQMSATIYSPPDKKVNFVT
jgi:hypothetical protein